MNTRELYDILDELSQAGPSAAGNRRMYEILMLACNEATKDEATGFGNLFSKVEYLCKRHHIGMKDRVAVQQMRRRANSSEVSSPEQWLQDISVLRYFVAVIGGERVEGQRSTLNAQPSTLNAQSSSLNAQRSIVQQWDGCYIHATTSDGEIIIDYGEGEDGLDQTYLNGLLHEGMQLNVLEAKPCATDGQTPCVRGLVVVEPDFLIDISALAALFTDYGHHELLYTVGRLQQRANSQAILLGLFAGAALDDIINRSDFSFGRTLMESFREQALQFCTCPDFSPLTFKADAAQQVKNLQEVVEVLFGQTASREKAILEPSFVCEALGLQGRVDLMTTDLRLLVEQKAGKLWGQPLKYKEQHYVQLLLYYGVLRYNFGLSDELIDMRLLYSRYPAHEGLMVVNFYRTLFREAIALRNRVVAQEFGIAREGFGSIVPQLTVDGVYGSKGTKEDTFFKRYIAPKIEQLNEQITTLNAVERAYLEEQMNFVYREQLYSKLGSQQGLGNAAADLWNMPLSEKRETGNIFTGLVITDRAQSAEGRGYDLLTLSVPEQGDDFLPNFRRGDMVYLYAYTGEPDVRHSLLFRGRLLTIETNRLVVRLNDRQQNPKVFSPSLYALEHDTSDIGTVSAIRSLMAFAAAPADKRQLLLGERVPQADNTQQLSRSYHPNYDDILLRQKQARDYFLLVGPPGTGKTSMALRFMVEEELAAPHSSQHSVLLLSYTNRAVDEMCGMLMDAGIDFLRLGNETSCDERFSGYLLDAALGDAPKLDTIRQRIQQTRVVVSTTATLQSRPFIFQLKHFSLCVVDEASQILEPNIIGLLASRAVGRFVLIGDYKQLPAVVQQPGTYESLFERLIRWERSQGRRQFMGTLRKQGRMHPEVAAFANEMFYKEERLEPVPCEHQTDTSLHYDEPSEDELDDLLKTRRVMFLDCGQPVLSTTQPPTSDKVNAAEARIVADWLRRIYRQYGADRFDSNKTVGVIVPYRNQIGMIRREIEQLGIPALQQVSVDTVERYQGSQRDVIIYSFTVQHRYQLDFLTANCFEENGRIIDRKLNVALTRARKQLLITGCAAVLQHNPLFAEFIRRYGL